MPDITFPQLNANQGTNTADALLNRANAAANAVCDLWENYPGALIPGSIDPLGVGAFSTGLFDGLCKPRGKEPAPPQVPVVGGQCDTLYNLSGTWQQVGGGSGSFDGGNGFGIISNVRTVQSGDGNDGATLFCDQGVGTTNQRLNIQVATRGNQDVGTTTFNFTPQRIDGLPDNCGQLPPQYPPPGTIPTPFFEKPVTINQYNTPITVPLVIIPVTFAPGSIVFRPEVTVDVGGVQVTFDLGGVTFNIGKGSGDTVKLPSSDPRPNPPTAIKPRSESAPVKQFDDTSLKCKVESLQRGLLDDGFTFNTITTAAARSVSIASVAGALSGVEVDIVSYPANLRIQPSTSPVPDVFYIGWFAWTYNGRPGERVPIHFELSRYEPVDEPDGFMFQVYAGCTARAKYTAKVERPYIDVCPI